MDWSNNNAIPTGGELVMVCSSCGARNRAPVEGSRIGRGGSSSCGRASVLFASMTDCSRGPLAAGLFNALVDPSVAVASSAGLRPASTVPAALVAAVRDLRGLDLSGTHPQLLTSAAVRAASLVVSLGVEGEFLDVGVPCMRWDMPVVNLRTTDSVARLHDALRERIRRLIASRGWARS